MRQTSYLIFSILFFLSACSADKSQEASQKEEITYLIDESATARIDSTLQSFVDAGNISGVSALIFEKDKEVYFNAFGLADRENNVPMDRNTIVRIFSMTKPITGTALMTLHEDGAFDLDDPLEKYAPEFANMQVYAGTDADGELILEAPNRPISIRDITRHTAGFGTNSNNPGIGPLLKEANAMSRENTLTQMAEKMGKVPLLFQPGTQWAYGPSVDVQAFLVERISGQPFDEYVRKNVLDPLGMSNTRYFVPEEDRSRLAPSYNRSDDNVLTRIPDERTFSDHTQVWPMKRGGSGLTSTLDDYMTFARMLVNEGTLKEAAVLKPETVKLMATNHLEDSVTERMWLPSKGQVGFGIDFAVRLRPPATPEENRGEVGEFFWDGAASTLFWVDPVNELTAVMFVQLFPYDKIGLHKGFRDAVYGSFVPVVE